jgi:hypothetical protein
LLDSSQLENLFFDLKSLGQLEPDKIFESPFGTNREWHVFPQSATFFCEWMKFLGSPIFIEILRKALLIADDVEIFPDFSYDGGGYAISTPRSFLGYQADFNFSGEVNKFRTLNILFCMNPEYMENLGGHLHLLDSQSKTVEGKVLPKANTFLAFKTDDESFHGVSRNADNFNCRIFNIYYYTDQPISENQAALPHRTHWLDTDSHDHKKLKS